MAIENLIIGGAGTGASAGKTFKVIEPATGEPLAEVSEGGPDDARRAVDVSYRAFEEGPWPRMPATQRGRVLLRASTIVRERLGGAARVGGGHRGQPHP